MKHNIHCEGCKARGLFHVIRGCQCRGTCVHEVDLQPSCRRCDALARAERYAKTRYEQKRGGHVTGMLMAFAGALGASSGVASIIDVQSRQKQTGRKGRWK